MPDPNSYVEQLKRHLNNKIAEPKSGGSPPPRPEVPASTPLPMSDLGPAFQGYHPQNMRNAVKPEAWDDESARSWVDRYNQRHRAYPGEFEEDLGPGPNELGQTRKPWPESLSAERNPATGELEPVAQPATGDRGWDRPDVANLYGSKEEGGRLATPNVQEKDIIPGLARGAYAKDQFGQVQMAPLSYSAKARSGDPRLEHYVHRQPGPVSPEAQAQGDMERARVMASHEPTPAEEELKRAQAFVDLARMNQGTKPPPKPQQQATIPPDWLQFGER